MGEFGGSYTTLAVPPEERARHHADYDAAETAAKSLNREELLAWLKSVGYDAPTKDKLSSLRASAQIRQMDLWWPRSFETRSA
jgi:hypothetical protein